MIPQFQVKGDDGLLLLKHNGIVVGGMFDSDNYNHNGLGQATLLDLERNDEVWMEVLSGGVRSNDNMYVHFIGILLRADTNWNINERIYQEEKQRS